MADDRDARIAQLEAENAALREHQSADRRQIAALRAENNALHAGGERRDHAIAEVLKQRTVLGEILHVIATFPTDPQRVLDAIVQTAAHLCDADIASVMEAEDGYMPTRASYGWRGGEVVVAASRERARA